MSWDPFKPNGRSDSSDVFTPVSSHTGSSLYGAKEDSSWAYQTNKESSSSWAYSTSQSPSSETTKSFYSSSKESEPSWAFSTKASQSGSSWAHSTGSFGGAEKSESWAYSSGSLSSGWLSSGANSHNSWAFTSEKPGTSSHFSSGPSADGFGFGRDSMYQFLKDRDKAADQGWEAKHWANVNEFLERQGQMDFLRNAEEKDSSRNFWSGAGSWAYGGSNSEKSSSWAFSSPSSPKSSAEGDDANWAYSMTSAEKSSVFNPVESNGERSSATQAYAPVSSLYRPFGNKDE
ncbi:MAG: hypothetical protein U0136_21825 [Bdellovibrionota bacterium]